MATKLIHGLPKNIAESINTDQPVRTVKTALITGMISANNLHGNVDRNILEQLGYKLPETIAVNKELGFIEEMWAENGYIPLLIIHQLREAGDTEGIKEIQRAYDQFTEVVNSYCTEEMAAKNQKLITEVFEVLKLAIK